MIEVDRDRVLNRLTPSIVLASLLIIQILIIGIPAYAESCEATILYDSNANTYRKITVDYPLLVKNRIATYNGQYGAWFDGSDPDEIYLLRTETRSTEITNIMNEYSYSDRTQLEDMGTPEDILKYFSGIWGTKSKSAKNDDLINWKNSRETKFSSYTTDMYNLISQLKSDSGISLVVRSNQETCATAQKFSINLSSRVEGDQSNIGGIIFDGTSYGLPQSIEKPASSYQLAVQSVPSGYSFSKWETTGGITVGSSTSQDTTATVSSGGSITMVMVSTSAGTTGGTPGDTSAATSDSPKFQVTYVDTADSREIGKSDPVWIDVDVENYGNAVGTVYVMPKIKFPNGEIIELDSQTLKLNPNVEDDATFYWQFPSISEPGTYYISIVLKDSLGNVYQQTGFNYGFSLTSPQKVGPFKFALSLSPNSDTIFPGQIAESTITIALTSGDPKPVTISCSLPSSQGKCRLNGSTASRVVTPTDQIALDIETGETTYPSTYKVEITAYSSEYSTSEIFYVNVKSKEVTGGEEIIQPPIQSNKLPSGSSVSTGQPYQSSINNVVFSSPGQQTKYFPSPSGQVTGIWATVTTYVKGSILYFDSGGTTYTKTISPNSETLITFSTPLSISNVRISIQDRGYSDDQANVGYVVVTTPTETQPTTNTPPTTTAPTRPNEKVEVVTKKEPAKELDTQRESLVIQFESPKDRATLYYSYMNSWKAPTFQLLNEILSNANLEITKGAIDAFLPDTVSTAWTFFEAAEKKNDEFKEQGSVASKGSEKDYYERDLVWDYHCSGRTFENGEYRGLCIEEFNNYGYGQIDQILSEQYQLVKNESSHKNKNWGPLEFLRTLFGWDKQDEKNADQELTKQKENLQKLKTIHDWLVMKKGKSKTDHYNKLVESTLVFLEKEILYLEST